ncbi:hypothetical protein B0J18DRAFT_461712 [Chaetomium sp. MPI-SDFR-AT-0129]|nr:hypothetical protein B0J18DRAFT_461712 [Chaetomium sp. MPI-SDFR-AT-0129]
MDYHALHGHDVSSFDLPSTHRLPTVSAAEALQALEEANSPGLITGLTSLDASLDPVLGSGQGGIQKGHVTEVWGPPGAGKTALGIQLAAHCLNQRGRVLWTDFIAYPSSASAPYSVKRPVKATVQISFA